MKKRLGCLTGSGITAALITLVAVYGFSLFQGGQMFNPGALNAQTSRGTPLGGFDSHAATGSECARCHPAPWGGDSMADRCLACHAAVGRQLEDSGTLHGALPQARDCRACHTEHHGRQGALTRMGTGEFPHDAVGFSLAGHQTMSDGLTSFTCADCHLETLARFDRSLCADCHGTLDVAFMVQHIQDFSEDCLACHDGVDTLADFDHRTTDFPLTGEHDEPRCAECHTNGQLEGLDSACYACHAASDEHDGQFGTDCAACHVADDWDRVTFDHARAAFPLDGAHLEVECEECHTAGFAGTPAACEACHAEPEVHLGEFGSDCAACHTTTAWTPATLRDHTFPLDHRSREVIECRVCHPDVFTEYTCSGCHEHAPARVEREHLEEGIRDFADCVDCHPTGREEEGEGRGGDD